MKFLIIITWITNKAIKSMAVIWPDLYQLFFAFSSFLLDAGSVRDPKCFWHPVQIYANWMWILISFLWPGVAGPPASWIMAIWTTCPCQEPLASLMNEIRSLLALWSQKGTQAPRVCSITRQRKLVPQCHLSIKPRPMDTCWSNSIPENKILQPQTSYSLSFILKRSDFEGGGRGKETDRY